MTAVAAAAPQRLRLSRRKGYRLPADAVKVSRQTRWGNPFAIRGANDTWVVYDHPTGKVLDELAQELGRRAIAGSAA
jgi:hypothetical protein